MIHVTKAEWRRAAELEGKPVSEVEVWVAGQQDTWKVYMEKAEHGYRIHQILKNDADYDLDWYDNDMHQAYEDISNEVVPAGELASFASTVAELAHLDS